MKLNGFQRPVLMTTKIDLQSWMEHAISSLQKSETPFLEVQVIAAFVLGQSREWVIAHSDNAITAEQLDSLNTALSRLQAGEPLAYITGTRSFYGMDFKVTPEVLIPRPETELLVEEASQWLENNPRRRSAVDIGTGSGVIAISLADTFLDLKITGIDISACALEVARANSEIHHSQERIVWQKNDLLEGIMGSFDLILANLPYIPSHKLDSLEVVKFEPRLALDGGADGLQLIRRLLAQSAPHIRAGGAIFLEIESTLGEPTLALANEFFPQAKNDLHLDYANLPRLVRIQTY